MSAAMYYADCPTCGNHGQFVSHDRRKRTTLYECRCGCLYGTLVAANGLRLNTTVLVRGGGS
jgi:hypothetical protein